MGVRVNNGGAGHFLWLPVATGLPNINAPNWWQSWIRVRNGGTFFGSVMIAFDGSFNPYEYLGFDSDNTTLRIASSSGSDVSDFQPTIGTGEDDWFWVAMGRHNTTGDWRLYAGDFDNPPALAASVASDATGRNPIQAVSLSYITGSGQETQSDFAYMRWVEADRTLEQLTEEYYSATPVHTGSLYAHWAFTDDANIFNDQKVGGTPRNWTTAGGTPIFVADPILPTPPAVGGIYRPIRGGRKLLDGGLIR